MKSNVQAVIQELASALVALVLLVGALVVSIVELERGADPNNVPSWLTLGVGAVIAWYFQSRNTNSVIATLTNGPLHTIASLSQRAPQRSTDPPEPPTPETPAA